ncbi:hypothetical protein P10VF_207 [Rhizobium phage vB_RleM_P10VF]|uniref:Uncharacterized protein n=2 Tax=Innesvirus TaxID=3044739 RepID=A0A076YM02_9CAUD|nr:hypothetical protein P10VF_207 [Rhizobium phage vB_RleM_P10VF]YP_010662386.1 hypothetical protein PP938_gp236 [Rhizobium phage AF3]AIK68420.1 hypothetical protein P10VF_207 [Rhizobium phage vB_RleM_P10VF]QNH71620.1 hypothetical protein AF3_236 [Rhizobium phage AF3]
MKWYAHAIDGYWWTGIHIRGVWTPLFRVGRVGDCVRF